MANGIDIESGAQQETTKGSCVAQVPECEISHIYFRDESEISTYSFLDILYHSLQSFAYLSTESLGDLPYVVSLHSIGIDLFRPMLNSANRATQLEGEK